MRPFIHLAVAALSITFVSGFAQAMPIGLSAKDAHAMTSGTPFPVTKITMMSEEGNREVARRFESYRRNAPGCQILGPGERVLLTGFGLFTGVTFNVSGAFIENFAHPAIWPDHVSTARAFAGKNSVVPKNGKLMEQDRGARVYSRHLSINHRDYNVCFVVVDVLWDFAGAVIAREMEQFQPDLVIMSGRGPIQPVIEGAALNQASHGTGYNFDSSRDQSNKPTGTAILPDDVAGKRIAMTWDNQALHRRVARLVSHLGYQITAPKDWSPNNDYVCNNVSYIALNAAQENEMRLAGGELILSPVVTSKPQVGFFHFPMLLPLETPIIRGWARVYANMIDEALNHR